MIYLDYNATAPLLSEARTAMEPYLGPSFGNPSSVHGYGQEALRAVLTARERVAVWVGARRDEVLFTGSGTESVVTGIVGAARANRDRGNHILLSAVEHAAVLEAGKFCRELGFEVDEVACDVDGRVGPERLAQALRPDTILVSVMHANNETGVVQPIQALSLVCKEHGALFHVDAAQTAGKRVIDMNQLGCDFLSLSAHKCGGPKGAGALVRKGKAALKAHIPGHQEQGLRGGTLNVPAIAGMGAVADASLLPRDLGSLQTAFETGVQERIPAVRITAQGAPRLGNVSHLTFPGFRGRDLVPALDLAGFCVSSGSACMSGSGLPSHVLLAMGYTPQEAATAVRVSYGVGTTAGELEAFTDALALIMERVPS